MVGSKIKKKIFETTGNMSVTIYILLYKDEVVKSYSF
jgi:hypothetical protein